MWTSAPCPPSDTTDRARRRWSGAVRRGGREGSERRLSAICHHRRRRFRHPSNDTGVTSSAWSVAPFSGHSGIVSRSLALAAATPSYAARRAIPRHVTRRALRRTRPLRRSRATPRPQFGLRLRRRRVASPRYVASRPLLPSRHGGLRHRRRLRPPNRSRRCAASRLTYPTRRHACAARKPADVQSGIERSGSWRHSTSLSSMTRRARMPISSSQPSPLMALR